MTSTAEPDSVPEVFETTFRMKETDGWQLNILDTHGLHQDGNLKTRTVTYTSIPCENEPGFFWWNSPSEDIICDKCRGGASLHA